MLTIISLAKLNLLFLLSVGGWQPEYQAPMVQPSTAMELIMGHPEGPAISALSETSVKYGHALEINPRLLTFTDLYQFIDHWIGTPYRYGSAKKSGVDCSGFTGKLYKEVFGLDLSRSSAAMFTQVKPLQKDELCEGDLVFFKRKGRIYHVGVYLHNNYFVHASTSSGVIISSLDEPYYKNNFYKGGKVVAS